MLRVLLAVLAAVALAGCGTDDTTTSAPPAPGSPLAGTSLDGEAISLADFRGKPVFVNVWSSW